MNGTLVFVFVVAFVLLVVYGIRKLTAIQQERKYGTDLEHWISLAKENKCEFVLIVASKKGGDRSPILCRDQESLEKEYAKARQTGSLIVDVVTV